MNFDNIVKTVKFYLGRIVKFKRIEAIKPVQLRTVIIQNPDHWFPRNYDMEPIATKITDLTHRQILDQISKILEGMKPCEKGVMKVEVIEINSNVIIGDPLTLNKTIISIKQNCSENKEHGRLGTKEEKCDSCHGYLNSLGMPGCCEKAGQGIYKWFNKIKPYKEK